MLRRITTGKGRFVAWLHPVEPIGDHQNNGSRFKASQDRHGKGRFVPVWLLRLLPVETIGDRQNNGFRFKASQDRHGQRSVCSVFPSLKNHIEIEK